MRTVFSQQLDTLTSGTAQLCGLAGQAMHFATEALLQADLVLAERAHADYARLAALATELDEAAFSLLALPSLVVDDLRCVVAVAENLADVERMGALALHVARTARSRHPAYALPPDVHGYFGEMGRLAVQIGENTKSVVLTGDPHWSARLGEEDDSLDDLQRRLMRMLMKPEWHHGVVAAVDVALLGRYYERFADQAVQVARRVIDQATDPVDSTDFVDRHACGAMR